MQIKEKISQADAVIIGAGAGLSTSAGFVYDGELQKPEDGEIKRIVPSGLIPYCPHCGKPMSMNLRSDQTFVEVTDGTRQQNGTRDLYRNIKSRK